MKDRSTRNTINELRKMSEQQEEELQAVNPEVIGVVTDCLQLRVRSTPEVRDNNVVTLIDALSEVHIDEESSTDDFYKVCTASGIEGFCMKKHIAVRR